MDPGFEYCKKTYFNGLTKETWGVIFCAAYCKKTSDLIIPGGPLYGEIMKQVHTNISCVQIHAIFFYLQAFPNFRPNKKGDPLGLNSATIELRVHKHEII
jgi:hypothetical protein